MAKQRKDEIKQIRIDMENCSKTLIENPNDQETSHRINTLKTELEIKCINELKGVVLIIMANYHQHLT